MLEGDIIFLNGFQNVRFLLSYNKRQVFELRLHFLFVSISVINRYVILE